MPRWTLLTVYMLACNGSSLSPQIAVTEPGTGGGPGAFDTFADCITFEPARLVRFTAEEPVQPLTLTNQCGEMQVEVSFDDPSGVFSLPEGPLYPLETGGELTFYIEYDKTLGSHSGQVLTSLRVDENAFPLGPIELLGTAE